MYAYPSFPTTWANTQNMTIYAYTYIVTVPIHTPVVLQHLYETLVYRSLMTLGLGDLFWAGPCPEAGHGGNCFRDPTPPGRCYPLLLAAPEKWQRTTMQTNHPKVHKTKQKALQLRPEK